MIVAEN